MSTWNSTLSIVFVQCSLPHITSLFQNFYCCFRYYSMYGHVEKLAEEIKKGAASVEGVEAKLWQVRKCMHCYMMYFGLLLF